MKTQSSGSNVTKVEGGFAPLLRVLVKNFGLKCYSLAKKARVCIPWQTYIFKRRLPF